VNVNCFPTTKAIRFGVAQRGARFASLLSGSVLGFHPDNHPATMTKQPVGNSMSLVARRFNPMKPSRRGSTTLFPCDPASHQRPLHVRGHQINDGHRSQIVNGLPKDRRRACLKSNSAALAVREVRDRRDACPTDMSMPMLVFLNVFLLETQLLRRVQDEHLHPDVRGNIGAR